MKEFVNLGFDFMLLIMNQSRTPSSSQYHGPEALQWYPTPPHMPASSGISIVPCPHSNAIRQPCSADQRPKIALPPIVRARGAHPGAHKLVTGAVGNVRPVRVAAITCSTVAAVLVIAWIVHGNRLTDVLRMPGTIVADHIKVPLYVLTAITSDMIIRIPAVQVHAVVYGYLAGAHACEYAERAGHRDSLLLRVLFR